MKKTVAFALLGMVAGTSMAQSSVTLFGVVDANFRYVKNGSTSVKQLGTDGLNSSRLGFRGIEDLGGGLSAGFWLEAGLNPDDGTINSSGKFWHRRSTVSLLGGFGEVRLGRDFTPTYTGISDFDVFGDNGVGSFSKTRSSLTSAVQTNTRADNEVSYFLPKNLGGLYGQASVAAGEGTIGTKYIGGRVGYAAGPINVSGSYGTTESNAAGDKYKVGTVGASYDFGVLKLSAAGTRFKFLSLKEDLIMVGASVPVGPGLIKLSAVRANLSGGSSATRTSGADDATQVSAGYVHSLSKRTALYGTVSRITNKGAQNFVTAATTPTVPNGGKSTGAELGLRHSF